jgi:hypothetical protein
MPALGATKNVSSFGRIEVPCLGCTFGASIWVFSGWGLRPTGGVWCQCPWCALAAGSRRAGISRDGQRIAHGPYGKQCRVFGVGLDNTCNVRRGGRPGL